MSAATAITKDMPINQILEHVPESVELMLGIGLHCIGCGANSFESLEQGMRGHGFPEEMVERVVEDINLLYSVRQDKDREAAVKPQPTTDYDSNRREEDGQVFYQLGEIRLTEKAFQTLHELSEGQQGFQIRIEAGGCSGYNYEYDYAVGPEEDEQTYHLSGRMALYLNPFTEEKLAGTTIDYQSGLKGAGLVFDNPNVRRACHCGTSVKFR